MQPTTRQTVRRITPKVIVRFVPEAWETSQSIGTVPAGTWATIVRRTGEVVGWSRHVADAARTARFWATVR